MIINIHGHKYVKNTVKRTCSISLSSLWLSLKTNEMLKMCVYASIHTYMYALNITNILLNFFTVISGCQMESIPVLRRLCFSGLRYLLLTVGHFPVLLLSLFPFPVDADNISCVV